MTRSIHYRDGVEHQLGRADLTVAILASRSKFDPRDNYRQLGPGRLGAVAAHEDAKVRQLQFDRVLIAPSTDARQPTEDLSQDIPYGPGHLSHPPDDISYDRGPSSVYCAQLFAV